MAAAFLVSCSTDMEQLHKTAHNLEKTWTIRIEAGKAEQNATRGVFSDDDGATLKSKWYGTETFTASYCGNNVGTLTAIASETGYTTLIGTLSDETYAVDGILTLTPTKTVDYSGQTGTIESMSSKDFLNETTVTIRSINTNAIISTSAATFTRKQSYTKFTFNKNVSSVTISAEGLVGSPITITPASGTNVIYAALSSTSNKKQVYCFSTGSQEGKLAAKIEEGNYYASPTITLAIPPSYGQAYYSDGSWGSNPHSTGATIIGMVCYAGNDTGVDGYYRGLAMALTDAAQRISWSDVTDIACLPNQGSTVALALADMDGKTNTDILLADGHSHPAAAVARNYTPAAPSSSSGWFLPSSGQWGRLLESLGASFTRFDYWVGVSAYSRLKSALNAVGGTMMVTSGEPGSYWSSSEHSSSNAIDFPFAASLGTSIDHRTKAATSDCVRAFLAF